MELRAATADDGKPRLTGYAAVFNRDSIDMGNWTERVAPGAFAKSISEGDVRALWNHNTDIVLGRTRSGTLSLSEDEHGLRMTLDPPDTQYVRDLVIAPIARGDVDQVSFGFRAVKERYEYDAERDWVTRTLLEVRLYEVSPVAMAAYPDTIISARALEQIMETRARKAAPEPPTGHSGSEIRDLTLGAWLATEAEALDLEVDLARRKGRL